MTTTDRPMTRADLVRARRSQRKNIKPSAADRRLRKLDTRVTTPMVARGVVLPRGAGRAAPRPKSARRRYHLALNTSGAELRLPALPVLRVGWRLVSGSMVVVLLLTIYTLLTVPLFRVPGVDVSGIERLSSQEINRALRLSGTPIFLIDRQAVLGVLQSTFPELSDISVHVGFPAAITVEVGERQPVLAWEQAGVVVWVDRSGIAFPPRGIAEGLVPVQAMDAPPLVPDSDGSLPRLISPQMVAAILELSQQVPEQTTLLYDPEHGLGWADPLGWQVYFGLSPQDIPSRLAVYNAIIETLQKRRMTPVLISVEYLHAPYYRLVP